MVTLVIVKNAFSPQDGREVKQIQAGCTVEELLKEYAIEGVELQATINGDSVDSTTKVNDDDFVVIYPAIEKGGKGGKGILGIIAAIALSVVAFGVGGALASVNMGGLNAGMWAVGASHFGLASYLGMAAVMFLGSSLMGRFMGQKVDTGSYSGEKDDPSYGWGGVQTMEGQNNSIPLTYGIVKSGGQTISKFVTVDDNDEYLNWLVAAGEGELTNITDVQLNDNPYNNYDDVSVEIRKGTNDQKIIDGFGDTYSNKTVSRQLSKSWIEESVPGGNMIRGIMIEVVFPNGLYHVKDNGEREERSVTLDVEYRLDNGDGTYGAWTNLFKAVASNSYGVTLNKNVKAGDYAMSIEPKFYSSGGDNYDYEVFAGADITIGDSTVNVRSKDFGETSVIVGAFKVNTKNFSSSVIDSVKGGTTVSDTITVSNGSGSGVVTSKSSSALRKQFKVNKLTEGQYEIRVKRTTAESTDDRTSDACQLAMVSGIIYDDFTYPNIGLIGIKARATDQLSGSPTLSFLKERRYVWVWNGSVYVKKRANNPAWACYDLLHQASKIKNIKTGEDVYDVRGVPADRMRYADFNRWASWCNTMKLYVNIEINQVGEMLDVANQKIAPIGRGMVVRFGTKYGCIYDHVQQPVQMFGMGNIVAGTFQEEFLKVADRANCVEVTFTNADADYQRDVLTIYGDTFDSDGYAKTAQLTMDGITDYQQAYREGKYQLMCNKYQLRTVSFEADIDAIACTVGDVVMVSHDVPKWAYSGRIEEINGNQIKLPCYVTDTSKSYRIQYRKQNDNIYTKNCSIVSSTEDGWTVISVSDTSDMPEVGDVFDLAIANIGSKPFVIKGITRSQEFRRRITAIEYAEALYDESYDIPPIQYSMTENNKPKNVTNLSASQYQYTDANRVKHGVMSVSWKKPSNGGKFTVSVSTDGKKWETKVSETEDTSVEFEVKSKTAYYVRVVTTLGLRQSSGVTTDLISYGVDTRPASVTGLTCKTDKTDRTKAELTWDANTDIDFRYYRVIVEGGKTYTTMANIITIISAQDYPTVSVIAVDNAGNASEPASIVVPIVNYPSNVTGFAVAQQRTDRSVLEFTWDAVTDSDLSQYELRIGESWDGGTQFARTKTRKTTYQITQSGNYTFWIAAQNAAGNYSQSPVSLNRNINIVPDAVTNLKIVQNTKDISKAIITFNRSAGEDIARYEIKYGNNWDNGTLIAETKNNRFEWQVLQSGTYNVMVRAVTVAEQYSAITNGSITITIEPLDVTGFTATQSLNNKSVIILSWDVIDKPDIAGYEVRQGTSWESAAVIAPKVSGNTFETTINTENLYTWMVKAVTIAGNKSQYAAKTSGIFGMNPTPVETIQLRQNPNDRSELQIQWTPVNDGDLVGYQVKVGDTWDSADDLPLTNEVYATYKLPETNSYHVMIKTLNSAGFYSDETSASLRCKVEPTNATNFIAYQNGEEVELYWTNSVDTDVVGYEIREGLSFDTGTLISTGIPNNYYKVGVDVERMYRYHIVAINRAGFYSDTPANTSVMVENLPIKNVVLSFDEITRQSGTHSNTEFGESLINFQTVGGRFSDYPTTRWTDLGGQEVLKLKRIYDTEETVEKTAYVDTVPTSITGTLAKLKKLGGKTLVWNQLVQDPTMTDASKWQVFIQPASFSVSVADNVLTVSRTANNYNMNFGPATSGINIVNGHKYYISSEVKANNACAGYYRIGTANIVVINITTSFTKFAEIITSSVDSQNIGINITYSALGDGAVVNVKNFVIVDLTLLYGAGNEPTTVEQFREMFPADYYEYNAGELLSAGVTEVKSVGKNRINIGVPYYSGNGLYNQAVGVHFASGLNPNVNIQKVNDSKYTMSVNSIWQGILLVVPLKSGENVHLTGTISSTVTNTIRGTHYYLDAQHNVIRVVANISSSTDTVTHDVTRTAPSNCAYFAISYLVTNKSSVVTFHNMQIEYGSTATTYSPYKELSYPIPAEIQALDGYGWSAGTAYNYIDYEAKKFIQNVGSRAYASGDESDSTVVTDMTTTYYPLNPAVETDISAYLTDDNLISVESGGTLTFPNQHGDNYRIPVPLKYDYLIDMGYPLSGVYELEQIDVGQVITADISAYFVSTSMYSAGVSAILQFRTSLDGTNWIDWMDFKPLQRSFRYVEFKVILTTNDTTKTPEVNHLVVSIDVPDTDIAITYAIAQGGTTVPYGHEFYSVPNVTASAIGNYVHTSVISRNKTECVIKILDNNNNDVGGTADIKIKGY